MRSQYVQYHSDAYAINAFVSVDQYVDAYAIEIRTYAALAIKHAIALRSFVLILRISWILLKTKIYIVSERNQCVFVKIPKTLDIGIDKMHRM